MDRSDTVTLVTGSTQGLGAVIARQLAAQGCFVIVHGCAEREAGHALVEEIVAADGRAAYVPFDVREDAAVQAAVEQIESAHGPIDTLIDCTSRFDTKSITELTSERWHEVIASTLHGSFHLCQEVLPRMQMRQHGRVILFGCVGCERNYHGTQQVAYRIAASGNLSLVKAYAQSYARDGITVNLIAPGHLENTDAPVDPATLPLGRLSQLEEILPAIQFLLSDDAAHVNGAQINVSGGYVR